MQRRATSFVKQFFVISLFLFTFPVLAGGEAYAAVTRYTLLPADPSSVLFSIAPLAPASIPCSNKNEVYLLRSSNELFDYMLSVLTIAMASNLAVQMQFEDYCGGPDQSKAVVKSLTLTNAKI